MSRFNSLVSFSIEDGKILVLGIFVSCVVNSKLNTKYHLLSKLYCFTVYEM